MSGGRDVDVLVVGSGAAGLAAALSATEAGAGSVLVAEAEGVVGGSSRLSGGLTMGAGTRYQRALGIADDADSLFHDYMTLNHWDVEAAVARRLADLAGPTVEWLGDLGVEFYDQMVYGGDERLPRVHVPIGRGQAVVDVLHRACRQAGVDVALGQRVDRLLVEDGAVVGARAGEVERRGPVVLATSTYDWDPELVREFLDLGAEDFGSVAPDSIRGDGIRLARAAGAATATIPATHVPMLPGWRSGTGYAYGPEYGLPHCMIVDAAGRRFCDDSYWVDIVAKVLDPKDRHLPFFLIWDEQHHRKYGFGATPPGAAYPAGLVTSAPTLLNLGSALGIDGSRLEATAARSPVAVMCSETLWWRCHRRLLADALVARRNRVVHLLGGR